MLGVGARGIANNSGLTISPNITCAPWGDRGKLWGVVNSGCNVGVVVGNFKLTHSPLGVPAG